MTLIGLGFIGVTVICYWALAVILHKTDPSLRRVNVGVGAWLLFSAILGYIGFFENFERLPPRIGMFAFIEWFALIYLVFFSRFKDALAKVSGESIYALQSFRIPVEFLLSFLMAERLLPREMTWAGWNFDILTGVTALGMAFLAYKKRLNRKIELVWNFAGLGLVLWVMCTGLLSAPPLRLIQTEPPTFIVGYFPFNFLPQFLVPLAITLHLIVLRRHLVKESPV